jgi:hypothetical protein
VAWGLWRGFLQTFGDYPIHNLLTGAQLAEVEKSDPSVLLTQAFVVAKLRKTQPAELDALDSKARDQFYDTGQGHDSV